MPDPVPARMEPRQDQWVAGTFTHRRVTRRRPLLLRLTSLPVAEGVAAEPRMAAAVVGDITKAQLHRCMKNDPELAGAIGLAGSGFVF